MPPLMGSSLPLKPFSLTLSLPHLHPFSLPPYILVGFKKSRYFSFFSPRGPMYPELPHSSTLQSLSVPPSRTPSPAPGTWTSKLLSRWELGRRLEVLVPLSGGGAGAVISRRPCWKPPEPVTLCQASSQSARAGRPSRLSRVRSLA